MIQPDENDVIFTSYSANLRGLLEALIEFFGGSAVTLQSFFDLMSTIWLIVTIVGVLLSLLFVYLFIYATIRFNQLGALEVETWITGPEKLWRELYGGEQGNKRWEDIQLHIDSDNPNEWRVAIIEADILLGEVLDNAGYIGKTIGEQLKGANTSNFESIQDAWAAHLVRNEIAHSGADFVLTHKLARETITQYQRVFNEFRAI